VIHFMEAPVSFLLDIIFTLKISFIWLIILPSLTGNVLRERVMYFLLGHISVCSHFYFLLVTTPFLRYHLYVPVQEYHHQPKMITRVLPYLHIHFVREAGRGWGLRLVVVHKSA
jgi:hypothetical protein